MDVNKYSPGGAKAVAVYEWRRFEFLNFGF